MAITSDFESENPSSILGGTYLFLLKKIYIIILD